MTHASESRQTLNLYWENMGNRLVIRPRARWDNGTVDVREAAASIDGGVPAQGWRELAADFLERMSDD